MGPGRCAVRLLPRIRWIAKRKKPGLSRGRILLVAGQDVNLLHQVTTLPAGCTPEQIESIAANGYSRFPIQAPDGQIRDGSRATA